MNPRKYPRTLAEAFGPYTSHHITEPRERRWQDWALYAVAVLGLVVIVFFARPVLGVQ